MSKKRALAVDNHPVFLKLMAELLKKRGLTVVTADSGLSALDILQDYTPDIIFVDLVMPNIGGEKLCQAVRSMARLKSVYIVVLSAVAAEEQPDFKQFGANDCIAKGPFDKMKRHIYHLLDRFCEGTDLVSSNGILGTEDIHERDITRELLAAKRHFEIILGHMAEGVLELTPDARIIYANSAAISFIGIPEVRLLGVNFTDLFHPDHRKTVESVLSKADSAVGGVSEKFPVSLNSRYIALDFIPVHNGWQKTIIAILHDVTARKRARESLQESEQRFKSLSENAPDIIYTLDLDGCFTYVNPAWEKTLGHEKSQVLGRSFTDFVEENETAGFRKHFEQLKNGKETITDITGTLVHKDGFHRRFSLSAALNLDPEGRPVGTVGLLKDITQQQRLETQLRRTEKMEAIGSLAGGVAHDLNNILAGLVSYPDLLLMRVAEDSPLRRPILKMKKSGEKVAAMVQDLLTLTRRGTDVSEVVSFSDIISDYLQSPEYEKLKSYHDAIRIKTRLDNDLLNVLGSPVHLSKTFMNLISNAVESMPNGGTLRVSAENRYVDTPIKGYDDIQEGDYVVLTISDEGVGIAKTDLKRIFEPFYTKKVMGRSGTGLGMAVVWATVKDHNGYIDVESDEGQGTTFFLYFPATRKAIAKDHPHLSINDYKGDGEFLLVVDDVEEQREVAKEVLQTLGYSVASVSSGEEAIRYIKRNSADLLVLDMIMGSGIDGLDTYKKILKQCPEQKAIIASGFSETERVREAQRLGAGPYIKKPYTLEKIGTAVKEVLSG